MKRSYSILLILIVVFVVSACIFYPKHMSDCKGDYLCYGIAYTYTQYRTWLNFTESTFEKRPENATNCIGVQQIIVSVRDGCPADWGWDDAAQLDCRIVDECKYIYCYNSSGWKYQCINRSLFGVSCNEWNRVCAAIKHADKVNITILSVSETKILRNTIE